MEPIPDNRGNLDELTRKITKSKCQKYEADSEDAAKPGIQSPTFVVKNIPCDKSTDDNSLNVKSHKIDIMNDMCTTINRVTIDVNILSRQLKRWKVTAFIGFSFVVFQFFIFMFVLNGQKTSKTGGVTNRPNNLQSGYQRQYMLQNDFKYEIYTANMLLNVSSLINEPDRILTWTPDRRAPKDRRQIPYVSGRFKIPRNGTYIFSSTLTVFYERKFDQSSASSVTKQKSFEHCFVLEGNHTNWCQQTTMLMGTRFPTHLVKTLWLHENDVVMVSMSNKDVVYRSAELNTLEIRELFLL